MKILGIGNAIVDVISKVNENFLNENKLSKSNMKLIFDDEEFKKLLCNLKIEKTVSGGSVANSIVGLSQLGDKVGFIGKVSDDTFGQKYEVGLKKENVEYLYKKKKRGYSYRDMFNISNTRLRENYVYFFGNCRQN